MGEAKRKQASAGQVFRVLVDPTDRFELASWLFRSIGIKGRVDRKLARRAADALDLRQFRSRILDEAPKLSGGGITYTDEERVALRRSVALDASEAKVAPRKFTLTVENVEFLDKIAETLDLGGGAVVGGLGELIDDLTELKASPPEDGAITAVGRAQDDEGNDEDEDHDDEPEDEEDEDAPAPPPNGTDDTGRAPDSPGA